MGTVGETSYLVLKSSALYSPREGVNGIGFMGEADLLCILRELTWESCR